MKRMSLNHILKNIDLKSIPSGKNFIVECVETEEYYLDDNTLLFHRDRDEEITLNKLNKYNNCAIITEIRKLKKIPTKNVVIIVDNVDEVYWKFVNYYRGLFNIPIAGVTGSCGKTTTKEMIKYIFSEKHKVRATYSSQSSNRLNLDYLLGIDDETKYAVFELGVLFSSGDILDYCKYFKPNIGVITSIGVDHIRNCKTLYNYINAKAELLEGLDYKGTLILNGDDRNISKINLDNFRGKIFYFGKGKMCDFKITDIRYNENGMTFKLSHKKKIYDIYIPGYGEHNVYNAVAAIAATHTAGISIIQSIKRIKTYKYIRNHLEKFIGINEAVYLDDTWSSTPTSVNAALQTLNGLGKDKTKIAFLGRMSSELDHMKETEHIKIGKSVVDYDIDYLITRGELAKVIAKSAIENGMDKNKVICCEDSDEVYKNLVKLTDNNSVVLIKTSTNDSSEDLLKKLKGRSN